MSNGINKNSRASRKWTTIIAGKDTAIEMLRNNNKDELMKKLRKLTRMKSCKIERTMRTS